MVKMLVFIFITEETCITECWNVKSSILEGSLSSPRDKGVSCSLSFLVSHKIVPTFLQECPWESLAWRLVLDSLHPLMFSQDFTAPCATLGHKLSSRNVAGLSAGILCKRNKLGYGSLVLEESLFVSAALERLFQNSSSMCKVAPVILPRLRSSGRSAGHSSSSSFIHPIFPRCWRSERSRFVICLSEPVLLPCLV